MRSLSLYIKELKQRRRRRQRERQKSNWFRLAKQQLFSCITLFCTFLCRQCTTTTWNCLISRFSEDANTRLRVSFSFLELWCSILEFNSRNICQYLTKWTRWNKRDKVWSSETSLFKWRIRGRCRRCCLSSLLLLKQPVYLPFVLINGRCFPLFIFTPRLYCFFKQIFFLRLLQVEKGLTAKLLTQVTALNLVGII